VPKLYHLRGSTPPVRAFATTCSPISASPFREKCFRPPIEESAFQKPRKSGVNFLGTSEQRYERVPHVPIARPVWEVSFHGRLPLLASFPFWWRPVFFFSRPTLFFCMLGAPPSVRGSPDFPRLRIFFCHFSATPDSHARRLPFSGPPPSS